MVLSLRFLVFLPFEKKKKKFTFWHLCSFPQQCFNSFSPISCDGVYVCTRGRACALRAFKHAVVHSRMRSEYTAAHARERTEAADVQTRSGKPVVLMYLPSRIAIKISGIVCDARARNGLHASATETLHPFFPSLSLSLSILLSCLFPSSAFISYSFFSTRRADGKKAFKLENLSRSRINDNLDFWRDWIFREF